MIIYPFFNTKANMDRNMKLPRKITIAGVSYEIILTNKISGGEFNCLKQVIKVGTKGTQDWQFQVLIHEIIEAIFVERNHRYELCNIKDNEHFLFNFSHDEFDNICKDIAFALRGLICK